MKCPVCGAPEFQPRSLAECIKAQVVKVTTVVAAATVAVYGQAEMLGEPTRHYVTVGSILVAVAVAVFVNLTGANK